MCAATPPRLQQQRGQILKSKIKNKFKKSYKLINMLKSCKSLSQVERSSFLLSLFSSCGGGGGGEERGGGGHKFCRFWTKKLWEILDL